jgi:tetratricopeptide (TPR) repeat protein
VKLAHATIATCLLAAPLLATVQLARASGESDSEVKQLLDAIYEAEYKQGKFKDAIEKINVGRVLCEGDLCTKKMRAQILVAIGTMHARLGETAKASEAFAGALKEDPSAEPRKEHATPEVTELFEKAKEAKSSAAPAQGCRKTYANEAAPRGWKSGEAAHCYEAASKAEQGGDLKTCENDARHSLELEDTANGHAVLARCLEAENNWIEAVEEWQETARQAPRFRQIQLAQQASYRAGQLRRRIPVLVINPPSDKSDGFQVQLDGTPIPIELLGQEVPVNPGEHTVLATAKRGTLPLRYKRVVRLDPGASLPVTIELTPYSPEIKCILEATSAEALAKCVNPPATTNLAIKVGTEVSGYHDSMHVDVLTPAIRANLEHVTQGWGIGAAFIVDMVTAASVDIVATASPRWREVRWVPAINGHKKFGDVDVAISGSLSHEPDYLSGDVGAKVAVDLVQKTITPTIAYNFSHDVNAKAKTPWSVYAKHINRHAVTLDLGLVLTKATFGSLTFTMVFENGDTSKPYRHIPMFTADLAGKIRPGESIDNVNLLRLSERPLEQLPDNRKRFAVAAQVAHRFKASTLRVSERLYADTWALKATTTDAKFLVDVLKDLRVWPHLRFHAQSGTNFYELAYSAAYNGADGSLTVPTYRTGDRELGPLMAATFGGGIRYQFGARKNYSVGFSGDVVYTRFWKALFTKDRWGYFGALNFEAAVE